MSVAVEKNRNLQTWIVLSADKQKKSQASAVMDYDE
jgi:hypothetical protein